MVAEPEKNTPLSRAESARSLDDVFTHARVEGYRLREQINEKLPEEAREEFRHLSWKDHQPFLERYPEIAAMFKNEQEKTTDALVNNLKPLLRRADPQLLLVQSTIEPTMYNTRANPAALVAVLSAKKEEGSAVIDREFIKQLEPPLLALAADRREGANVALLMAAGLDPSQKSKKEELNAFDVAQDETTRALLKDPAASPLAQDEWGKNAVDYNREALKVAQLYAKDNKQIIEALEKNLSEMEKRAGKEKGGKAQSRIDEIPEGFDKALAQYEKWTEVGHLPDLQLLSVPSAPAKTLPMKKRIAII